MYTVINNVINIVKRSVSFTTASTLFRAHITESDDMTTSEKKDITIGSRTFFRMSGVLKKKKDKNMRLIILK